MKEEICKIIQQPESFSSSHLSLLEKVIEDFPYFQPAYFLLIKYYRSKSIFEFNEKLHKYIWHITDKQLLSYFLHHGFLPQSSGKVKAAAHGMDNEIKETKENKITATPFSTRREKDSLKETLAETLKQANRFDISEEFEKKILPDIDFELDESMEIIKPSDSIELPLLKNNTKENELDVPVLELDENISDQEKQEVPEEYAKHGNSENSENFVEKGGIETTGVHSKTLQQIAIIDQFLEKLPHIKPQPIEETVPVVDISQESVEVHDDFMTETFARILVKQGSYDKAIEIYQKLILKFPEKNTYFASQIEEIEKLKNNNPKQ